MELKKFSNTETLTEPAQEALASIESIISQLKPKALEVDAQIGKIKKQAESLENEQEKRKYFELIKKRLKRMAGILSLATSLAAAGLVYNYERTRYKVDEVKEGSEITYSHEDPETTQIIEYISGRKPLNRETQIRLARARAINYFNYLDHKPKLPSNIEKLPEAQFKRILLLAYDEAIKSNPEFARSIERRKMEFNSDDWVDLFVPSQLTWEGEEDAYKILWEIEKRTGNPKIRWELTSQVAKFLRANKGGGTHYDFLTNTMYISEPIFLGDIVDAAPLSDFAAEAAHAQQANEKPISAIVQDLKAKAIFFDLYRRVLLTEGPFNAYELSYNIPGTLEHDAHTKIEPQINKRVNKILYKDVKR